MAFQAYPIIHDALQLVGFISFGDEPEAAAAALGARLVNDILLEWGSKSIYNPSVVQFDMASNGTSLYRMGVNGVDTPDSTINPRAISLVTAKQGTVVWPLPVRPMLEWDAVMPKTITGVPQVCFWDAQLEQSQLRVWPIPPGGYSIGVSGMGPIGTIDNAHGTVPLPLEYQEALRWTLFVRLAPFLPSGQELNPKMFEYAERNMNTALSSLKRRNASQRTPGLVLDLPGGSARGSDGYMTWPGRAV